MELQYIFDIGAYIALVLCGALMIFMLCMRSFDHRLRTRFFLMISALVIAILAFIADDYLATFPYQVNLRYVTKLLKVIAEGFIEMQCAFVLLPQLEPKVHRLMALPFIIISILLCTCPFNDLICTIDESNNIVQGPFANLVYVEGVFYGCTILWLSFKKWKDGNQSSATIIIFVIALELLSIYLEVSGVFHNSILSTASIGIAFLYMYIYAERYNVDSVTECYKRRCFYSDGLKYARHNLAIISMDLNDLKVINDTYGHKAGDLALKTFADICKECKDNRYMIYRTGGDEFMMLGINSSMDDAVKIVEKIKDKLSYTDYSCSFGIAMYNGIDSFDECVVKADKAMYTDKNNYKEIVKADRNTGYLFRQESV